jgi:hypothetical protein
MLVARWIDELCQPKFDARSPREARLWSPLVPSEAFTAPLYAEPEL